MASSLKMNEYLTKPMRTEKEDLFWRCGSGFPGMNNEKESSAAARKQGFQQKGVFARVCRPLRAGSLAASEPQAGSVLQLLHEGSVFGIAGGRRKSA